MLPYSVFNAVLLFVLQWGFFFFIFSVKKESDFRAMTCNFFRLALPDVINFFALSTTHRNMILFRDTISIEIFLAFQIASASDNKDYRARVKQRIHSP